MSKTIVEFKKLPLGKDGELLPVGKRLISPRNFVLISFPKSGKTETMCNIPNLLLGDPQGGTDYYQASNVVNLLTYDGSESFKVIKDGTHVPMGLFQTVDELRTVNDMPEYWNLYNAFIEARGEESDKLYDKLMNHILKMKFPIFAIDPITAMQPMFHEAALADYNKQFNKTKSSIKRVDEYGGSQYIRRTILGITGFIERNAAPFIIYTGHIKEKKKVIEKGEDNVSVADMDFEGTFSTIFTQRSDANAIFFRDKEGCWLDFVKRDSDTDFDSRPPHLANRKVKIADVHTFDKEGNVTQKGKTYWNKVYPELKW
jgi:hypothetical protein